MVSDLDSGHVGFDLRYLLEILVGVVTTHSPGDRRLVVVAATDSGSFEEKCDGFVDKESEQDRASTWLQETCCVIMIVGVNGGGKTASLGKLAYRLKNEGAKILMAAGDTFRAAVSDQLEMWAERTGCEIVMANDANAKA